MGWSQKAQIHLAQIIWVWVIRIQMFERAFFIYIFYSTISLWLVDFPTSEKVLKGMIIIIIIIIMS